MVKFITLLSDKIPIRLNIAILVFMACFVTYMLRTNLPICLIAMVADKENDPNFGPRFQWDKHAQSLILGGYFYGYLLTPMVGGVMAEKFGGKNVIGICTLISAIVTFVTPLLAQNSFLPVFIARFLTGVLGGAIFPALHNLISHWAPKEEKGKFVSALLGGVLGNIVTWALLGYIIKHFGWSFGFYIPSFVTLLFLGFWYQTVTDFPAEHPSISPKERELIENSIGDASKNQKSFPPIAKIATSIPCIALMILHYGNVWGLFFLQTAAPKFMTEALNFELTSAGMLSSAPLLARLLNGFVFGAIGDYLRQKSSVSVTLVRKSFCLFSHVLPGMFLFLISFVAFEPYLCVLVMTLSMGFNGATTVTNLVNPQDLSPRYAGSIYGMINFIATTSGFLSPIIVAHFTQEESTVEQWKFVFWIGGFAYIFSAVIFMIFGSGEVQSWNEINEETKNNETVEKVPKDEQEQNNTKL